MKTTAAEVAMSTAPKDCKMPFHVSRTENNSYCCAENTWKM